MDEAIIISWPEDFDDPLAESILNFDSDNFRVAARRTEPKGLLAMLEWAIPTAFIVYLSGNFFKSFLTEAGKDAYAKSKDLLKDYIKKRRQIKTKLIAADSSPEKLSKSYDQSLTISLKVELQPGLTITVFVSERVDNGEENEMLESMFQNLMLLYEDCQKAVSESPDQNKKRFPHMYMIANLQTRQWELLTQQQMSERYKNR